MASRSESPKGRSRWLADGVALAVVALLLRLLIVAWAFGRFPPAADGVYYHRLATRLAAGQGYTWLWPDGAVTYAAHYPVGYPAGLAVLYRWLGPSPEPAMLLNAVLGALAVLAVHRLLVPFRRRRLAWLGAALVAVHPGLALYTPAIMTEGATASLVALAAWAVQAARRRGTGRRRLALVVAAGLVLGMATLVRPQSILLAPLFGLWLGARRRRGAIAAGLLCTAVALGVCAPWTLRNCQRMGRCALVSVNGGWNLLIGTDPAGRGAWAPLQVPEPCREVFDEADKDRCFGQVALERIRRHPDRWLRLAPAKLGATFDYCGAPGYYLHESNPAAFGASAKVALGVVETVFERLTLLLALLAAMPHGGLGAPWSRLRARRSPRVAGRRLAQVVVLVVGGVFALLQSAWVAYVALALGLLLRRPGPRRSPAVYGAALAVLLSLMLTHVVFFGAGRYALVSFPLLCALAAIGAGRLAAATRGCSGLVGLGRRSGDDGGGAVRSG